MKNLTALFWFRLRAILTLRWASVVALHRKPKCETCFRAPETPLPLLVRRGAAGGMTAVVLAYMAVLSAPGFMSTASGIMAAAFAVMGLAARQLRAAIAGTLIGGTLVLVGELLRITYQPGSFEWLLAQIFTAVIMGTLAGSSVQEQIRSSWHFLSRAPTVVWLGMGALGGLLLFSRSAPELLHPTVQALVNGGALLAFVVAVAGILSLIALAVGVAIGRALRRVLCPALPHEEKETWARWEVLYKP